MNTAIPAAFIEQLLEPGSPIMKLRLSSDQAVSASYTSLREFLESMTISHLHRDLIYKSSFKGIESYKKCVYSLTSVKATWTHDKPVDKHATDIPYTMSIRHNLLTNHYAPLSKLVH